MLQHECPLARAGRCRGGWVHDRDDREDLPAVLLCLDVGAVAADLAAGTLACPSCGTGGLAPWGYGRERAVRLRSGRTARLRPRRARCRSCHRTCILLPSWCAPRRALDVPAATVRGWLRRLRARAGQLRARHRRAGRPGLLSAGPPSKPAGSSLGDALNAGGRRRGLRPPQLRARAGDNLAAGGPAWPGPLPPARPRQLITCRRSRAPRPHPGRRRSPRPAVPAPRHHDHQPAARCPECPDLRGHRERPGAAWPVYPRPCGLG